MKPAKSIKTQKPIHHFGIHLIKGMFIMLIILLFSLSIGIFGYRYFELLAWEDALLNASTTLVGTGPLYPLKTTSGKIFVSIYAIYCGIVLIVAVWVLITPIVYRILHNVFDYYSKDE